MNEYRAKLIGSRREKAKLVRRLYEESELPIHKRRTWIAEKTGLPSSSVYELLNDPDGVLARERKARRDGECVDCGRPTKNSGSLYYPKRCQTCRIAYDKANKRWTREAIIASICTWADLYGKPPSAKAWNTSLSIPRDWERHQTGLYPCCTTVVDEFGSFSAGLLAAGFESEHPLAGKPRKRVSPEEYREIARLHKQHMAWQEIAQRFGITRNAAQQRYLYYATRKKNARTNNPSRERG